MPPLKIYICAALMAVLQNALHQLHGVVFGFLHLLSPLLQDFGLVLGRIVLNRFPPGLVVNMQVFDLILFRVASAPDQLATVSKFHALSS